MTLMYWAHVNAFQWLPTVFFVGFQVDSIFLRFIYSRLTHQLDELFQVYNPHEKKKQTENRNGFF